MENNQIPTSIDFLVDKDNLFREETITDLKIATIKRLVPVTPDGRDDPDRSVIFVGSTQLGTPKGPVPIQALLEAATLEQAMADFPRAMEAETKKVVEGFKQMQEAQKKARDSRIIMPGVQ